MAQITFEEARDMTDKSFNWMLSVQSFIADPTATPEPTDLYPTQKLAFEISKSDISALLVCERIIGILGYELEENTLTVILVGTNNEGKPSEKCKPRQTWPMLNDMKEYKTVKEVYLTP